MTIKKDKQKSIAVLKEHIEKAENFFEVNELNLENQKISANDWYQTLVADIEDIFYEDEAKEIVEKMNDILDENVKVMFTEDMMRAYGIAVSGNKHAKVDLFKKKVKKIIDLIKSIITEIQ